MQYRSPFARDGNVNETRWTETGDEMADTARSVDRDCILLRAEDKAKF